MAGFRVIEDFGSFVLDQESAVLTQLFLEPLAAFWNSTTDAAGPTTLATEILPGVSLPTLGLAAGRLILRYNNGVRIVR